MNKIDISKVKVKSMYINTADFPDFTDSFIESAEYDGREMTDEELDKLNEDVSFVYGMIQERLY